jgi:hypothetical protein
MEAEIARIELRKPLILKGAPKISSETGGNLLSDGGRVKTEDRVPGGHRKRANLEGVVFGWIGEGDLDAIVLVFAAGFCDVPIGRLEAVFRLPIFDDRVADAFEPAVDGAVVRVVGCLANFLDEPNHVGRLDGALNYGRFRV